MKIFRNNLSSFDLFALFTVMITIIYWPLSVWIFHFDGAGRIPTFFCILSFIVLSPRIGRYIFTKPFVFYFLLAVFQYVNGLVKGSYLNYDKDGWYLMATHIFLPFFSSLFVYNAARKNFDYTLKICTAGLFIYSLITFALGGLLSSFDRYSYSINANEIAFYCSISIGLFLLSYVRKIIPLYYLFFALIPVICVIITASRMGIVMIAIMLVGYWYIITFQKRISLTRLLSSIVFLIVFVVGFLFLMKYAEVGERLSTTTEQLESDRLTGTVLDHLGDRGPQYYFSWPYFLRHPFTGIGIRNWQNYSPMGLVCHSEYMVQYLEGGIISFGLYCFFWIFIFKSLFSRKLRIRDTRFKASRTYLFFILLSILFANSVLWSYDMYCVFIIYALVSGFSLPQNNNTSYRIISPYIIGAEKEGSNQ